MRKVVKRDVFPPEFFIQYANDSPKAGRRFEHREIGYANMIEKSFRHTLRSLVEVASSALAHIILRKVFPGHYAIRSALNCTYRPLNMTPASR